MDRKRKVPKKNILLFGEKEYVDDFTKFFREEFGEDIVVASIRESKEAMKYLMSYPVNLVLADISLYQDWSYTRPLLDAFKTLYPNLPLIPYYYCYDNPKTSVTLNDKRFQSMIRAQFGEFFYIRDVREILFPAMSHLKAGFSTEHVNVDISRSTGDIDLRVGKALAYINVESSIPYLEKFIDGDPSRKAVAMKELEKVFHYFEEHEMKSEGIFLYVLLENGLDLRKTKNYFAEIRKSKQQKNGS